MYKFLFGFSIVLFIACLILCIKTLSGEFNWISFIVAVLGMVSACLTLWTSTLLRKLKR